MKKELGPEALDDPEQRDQFIVQKAEELLALAKQGRIHSLFLIYSTHESNQDPHADDADDVVLFSVCPRDEKEFANMMTQWLCIYGMYPELVALLERGPMEPVNFH